MIDRKWRLFIVDDEMDFRLVLRDHFEAAGYEVGEAADGQEALETFEHNPRFFDLVITDIRMPRLDGEALIPKLRALRPYLPIIGVTGHTDLTGKLSMLDNGAYYYLDKPLPQWPIVDRLVENAIRLHRYEEEVAAIRAKENEIARLLRAYVMKETIEHPAMADGDGDRTIELDIRMQYIEHDRPGGDYVEYFQRSGREVVFYVADASGHADLLSCFMTCLASMVLHRSHHTACPTVDEIIRTIDDALSELREAGALGHERYLTFFIGAVDLKTGELAYVNAGHPEALLLHHEGREAVRLESNSRPVGFLFGTEPEVGRVRLTPGDLLFVYTDGASDLLELAGGGGVERLAEIVEGLRGEGAQGVVDAVTRHLRDQAGDAGFPDDTTLLAVKVGAA